MSVDQTYQCDCKVGRVSEAHGLTQLTEDLVNQRKQHSKSLRDLADYMNIQILSRVLDKHPDQTLFADPESIYSTLTKSDDTGKRAELRERLKEVGVPIDEVTEEFVSHQTIRSHLNSCLNIETGRPQQKDREQVTKLIEWARNRDEEIINRALNRLHDSGELNITEPTVIHSIRVICQSCGASVRLQELLEDGSCECS